MGIADDIFNNPDFVDHLNRAWAINSNDFRRIGEMVDGWDAPGAKVLDVGCGTGRMSAHFTRAEYHGIDKSAEMVWRCRARGLNVTQGCIFNLPFEDRSFDLVLCHAVVFHVLDWNRAVRELWRVTKKRLIFTSYYCRRPWPLNDPGVEWVTGEDPVSGAIWPLPKHEVPAWQIKKFVLSPKYLGVPKVDAKFTWIRHENLCDDSIVYVDLYK